MDTVSDRENRESQDKMLMLKILEAIKSIKTEVNNHGD